MNLHDWIDELCDVLDIDTEVDEALVLDLAKVAADNVERQAAPITTYLLGYAAGSQDADPEDIEKLAARAQRWPRSGTARPTRPDPVDIDDEVPDDSAVDHSADAYRRLSDARRRRYRARRPRGPVASPSCPTPSPGPVRWLIDVAATRGQPRRPPAAAGLLPAAARRLGRRSAWSAAARSRRSATA